MDRAAGAGLNYAYNHSSASPLIALRASGADTVVVGTSTGRYSIVPSAWPSKLVNFAQDGQTIFYSIAMARIASSEVNVRRIILAVDPYDLNSGLANPAASRVWRIAPTLGAFNDIAPLLSDTRPAGASVLAYLATWPYRGSISQIVRGFGKSGTPEYVALPAGVPGEPATTNDSPALSFSPSLDYYLAVLTDVARRPGLQLVLVVTPAYKDNRAAHPNQAALIADMISKMEGAPVCDLTGVDTPAIAELRTLKSNFHDGVHLTEAGATAYTNEINRLVEQRCR